MYGSLAVDSPTVPKFEKISRLNPSYFRFSLNLKYEFSYKKSVLVTVSLGCKLGKLVTPMPR